MTVGQLIIVLGALDPKLPVVVRGYEDGVNDISEAALINIRRDQYSAWYYGQHEKLFQEEDGGVQAIELVGTNELARNR